jgi:hypothetical protein
VQLPRRTTARLSPSFSDQTPLLLGVIDPRQTPSGTADPQLDWVDGKRSKSGHLTETRCNERGKIGVHCNAGIRNKIEEQKKTTIGLTSAFSLDPTAILPSFTFCRLTAAVASVSSRTVVELSSNDRLFPPLAGRSPYDFRDIRLPCFCLFSCPWLRILPRKAHGRYDTIQDAVDETGEHSLSTSRHIIRHDPFTTRTRHAYDSKLNLSISAHSIPRQLYAAYLSLIDDGLAISRFA